MKSKSERLNDAFININEAIKYDINDLKVKYHSNKISKHECIFIMKKLKLVSEILENLNSSLEYNNEVLDVIRQFNLSIMNLYDEGDYKELYNEIDKTNSFLCMDDKEKDRKLLMNFKKIYKGIPNNYQKNLCKAEYSEDNGLVFDNKRIDNYKFITENYLNLKYNFGKVKYNSLELDDIDKFKILLCDNVINSNQYDDKTKEDYSIIKDYLNILGKSSLISSVLLRILLISEKENYINIYEKAYSLMEKYNNRYNEIKEKYDLLLLELNNRGVGYNSILNNDSLDSELLELINTLESKGISVNNKRLIK